MSKKEKLIYLASPYSDASHGARHMRFMKVCSVAGQLIYDGYKIFCPIAMSHPIGEHSMADSINHNMWMAQDLCILERCDMLLVLTLEGWDNSIGVGEEIEFSNKNGIPIKYVNMKGKITKEPT